MSRFALRIAGGLLLLVTSVSFAHTQLESSTPADTSEVDSPSTIVLRFSEPVHVTAFVVEAVGGVEQAIGDVPTGPADAFEIPVTATLAPGEYLVSWRAVSADTHIVSGEFRFVVSG